ncbi:MAG: hypothetical protein WA667_15010 [Candidatus Nitrosopolaris sp.]
MNTKITAIMLFGWLPPIQGVIITPLTLPGHELHDGYRPYALITKMMNTITLLVFLIVAFTPIGPIIINNDTDTIKLRMPNWTDTCVPLIECSNTWNNTNFTSAITSK